MPKFMIGWKNRGSKNLIGAYCLFFFSDEILFRQIDEVNHGFGRDKQMLVEQFDLKKVVKKIKFLKYIPWSSSAFISNLVGKNSGPIITHIQILTLK